MGYIGLIASSYNLPTFFFCTYLIKYPVRSSYNPYLLNNILCLLFVSCETVNCSLVIINRSHKFFVKCSLLWVRKFLMSLWSPGRADKYAEWYGCCMWCCYFGSVYNNVRIIAAQTVGRKKTHTTHTNILREIPCWGSQISIKLFAAGKSITCRVTKDCYHTVARSNTNIREAVFPS